MCVYVSSAVGSDLCDPMDCSLPGSSVHGFLQARILEWAAFDHIDLCQQSDVSAFIMLSRFVIPFLPSSKLLFNFMIAVTVCSYFEAQENKVCHCFHFCTICLPLSDGTRCHDLSFLNVEFYDKFFSLSSRGSLVPLFFFFFFFCY